MEIAIPSIIGILIFLNLYSILKSVEYRESIKELDNEIEALRIANRNLAKIIQEDVDKKTMFEVGCG